MANPIHKAKIKLTDLLHKKNLQTKQSSPASKKSVEKK